MNMTEEELQEIRTRCDAATPGSWNKNGSILYRQADVDFVAHAREDVPKLLDELAAETNRAVKAEKAAIRILERFRDKCGWCRDSHNGSCNHNHDWDACNRQQFKITVEQVQEDEKLLNSLYADRDHWKARAEAMKRVTDCSLCCNDWCPDEMRFTKRPCECPDWIFSEARFAAMNEAKV